MPSNVKPESEVDEIKMDEEGNFDIQNDPNFNNDFDWEEANNMFAKENLKDGLPHVEEEEEEIDVKDDNNDGSVKVVDFT
jgi:hypothetical protein